LATTTRALVSYHHHALLQTGEDLAVQPLGGLQRALVLLLRRVVPVGDEDRSIAERRDPRAPPGDVVVELVLARLLREAGGENGLSPRSVVRQRLPLRLVVGVAQRHGIAGRLPHVKRDGHDVQDMSLGSVH
jgi:hypothetical protein